jgi:hypothetical protein
MPSTISLIASLLVPLIVAQAGPGLRGSPPPPPPVEHVTPRPGYVWIEGNYQWRDGRYAWTGGHWEKERPGRRWHGGHWDWRGDRYVWVRGEWIAGPAYAAPPGLVVQTPPPPPPPPPQAAPPPPQPRAGYVWIPPAHEWRDGHYVWIEGHWEKERRGHHWESGHWDRDGDRHAWHPGGWRRLDEDNGPPGGPRAPISIRGRVVDGRGAPVPGIRVVLAGTSEGRAITDGNGYYEFTGLGYGSYAVRPTAGGCGFSPDVVNLNNLGGPVVQDFSTSCGRR